MGKRGCDVLEVGDVLVDNDAAGFLILYGKGSF